MTALVENERGRVMLPESNGALIQHAPQPSDLAKALAAARDKCGAAAKDAKNAHHNYRYASADEVIEVAKTALEGTGLSLVPGCPKLRVLGSGATALFALTRTFVLIHASGEILPLGELEWPVMPNTGRPVDKAYAIAITSSLAYLYRDLLAMPRGTEDDMSARDDRGSPPMTPPVQPSAPPEQQMEPPSTPEPNQTLQEALVGEQPITDEQHAELVVLIRDTGTDGGKVAKSAGVPVLQKMQRKWFVVIREKLLTRKAEQATAAGDANKLLDLRGKVQQLVTALGLPNEAFKSRCKELYKIGEPDKLSVDQLQDLEKRLTAIKAGKPAA